MFVGVDGCKQGWVAVVLTEDAFARAAAFPTFDAVVAAFGEAVVVGVDMPIGLVDAASRTADRAARGTLTGQASSVFNAPARSTLTASSYEDANRISRAVCGTGMSRQSYAILDKVRQVDRFAADERLVEVHPELSFRLMNDGGALLRKKSWGGMHQRLRRLCEAGIVLPADLGDASVVAPDDVIDAAAAAWSARRVARGEARRWPEQDVERDPVTKRRIAIWG
jgi:predicted RNase H-like nuclease